MLAALFALGCWVCAAPARAETEIGLSLAPLVGTHDEGLGSSRVPPLPIPILEARQRNGALEIVVESLPIALRVGQDNGGQRLSTSLAFLDAVARVYAGERFYFGAGEMLYNQATTYTPSGRVDSSRVSGGRYEIGLILTADRRLRAQLDVMPHLSGDVQEKFAIGPRTIVLHAGETGSQVEMRLEYTVAHGATSVRYGIRYINYITRFNFSGDLSDHNVGFLPSVTFLWRPVR